MYKSTLPWPRHYKWVSGQQHSPAALYPRERPGTHCTGDWWAPEPVWTGGKSHRHRDFFRSRTFQPVVSRYTAWATLSTVNCITRRKCFPSSRKTRLFPIDFCCIQNYNPFSSNKLIWILVTGFITFQRFWRIDSTFTHSSSTNVIGPYVYQLHLKLYHQK